jgi:hypothetical protein
MAHLLLALATHHAGRRIVAAQQDTPDGPISADALLTVTVSDQATTPPSGTDSRGDSVSNGQHRR